MIDPRAEVPDLIQHVPPQLFPVWLVPALAKLKPFPSLQQGQMATRKSQLLCVNMEMGSEQTYRSRIYTK